MFGFPTVILSVELRHMSDRELLCTIPLTLGQAFEESRC
jgi:hypothetical protein